MGLLKEAANAAERELIASHMEKFRFNMSTVALSLGVDRKTLYNKVRLYEIPIVRSEKLHDEFTEKISIKIRRYNQMIYLVLDNGTGFIKIGRSASPDLRERSLMSQKPDVQLIWKSDPCNRYYEKILHKIFEKKRIRGEWFLLNEEDVNFIKSYDYNQVKAISE